MHGLCEKMENKRKKLSSLRDFRSSLDIRTHPSYSQFNVFKTLNIGELLCFDIQYLYLYHIPISLCSLIPVMINAPHNMYYVTTLMRIL